MDSPILLVEDTSSLQLIYATALRRAGHQVETANNGMQARAKFAAFKPDIVVLDLMLPDKFGLDVMKECLSLNANAQFIVVTSDGSIDRAIEAMRLGANDYLVKPFRDAKLIDCVANAKAALLPKEPTKKGKPADGLFGASDAIFQVLRKIKSVGPSMAAVFVTGESGTGKIPCALSIHKNSTRAEGPFVQINCGSFLADRMESELFGQVVGGNGGAIMNMNGALAAADAGTLLLNEICDLPKNLQTKLLDFLQSSEVLVNGASNPQRVNLRIIATSSVNPWAAVQSGKLLEDLFYRLYVIPIEMPPLRDRGEDIVQIAIRALGEIAREENRDFRSISTDVLDIFRRYSWPGNVRQLKNTLRNVVVLNEGPVVSKDMLADRFLRAPAEAENGAAAHATGGGENALIGKTLFEVERWVIEETIRQEGGSVPRAARILDVAPSTIYRKREAWAR